VLRTSIDPKKMAMANMIVGMPINSVNATRTLLGSFGGRPRGEIGAGIAPGFLKRLHRTGDAMLVGGFGLSQRGLVC